MSLALHKKPGIYKIENIINGHCYIGQSIDLGRRIRNHFTELKRNNHHNNHLQNAYKKHGKRNFVFSVLIYCENNELTRYEQWFVDTIDPEYNICRECVDSKKGIVPSEETKRKISESNKGKMNQEEKQKLSERMTGNKYALGYKQTKEERQRMKGNKIWLGRKHSEDSKNKISEAKKGNGHKHSEETKRKLSEANIGKKLSEETKRKISETKKARNARKRQEAQNCLLQSNPESCMMI